MTDKRKKLIDSSLTPEDQNFEDDKLAKLIQAAKDGDCTKVKELLLAGVNPNGRDEDEGKTALHWAVNLTCPCPSCAQSAESCVSVLLHAALTLPDINAQDNMGLTPLHIAAENQLVKICKMLIHNGGDVYIRSKSGEVAMSIIAKRTPDVIVYLLDQSISLDGMFYTSERCGLSIDFRTLLGNLDKPGGRQVSDEWIQPLDRSDDCSRYSSCRGKNELHVLRGLLRSSKLTRRKIFTHPAVAIFLDQKWRRVRKHFWATLLCYTTWLLLYTGYILLVYLINCPNKLYNVGSDLVPDLVTPKFVQNDSTKFQNSTSKQLNFSTPWNLTADNVEKRVDEPISKNKCQQSVQLADGGFLLLLILTVAMGANEVAKSLVTPRLYFQSRLNALSWALVVMSFVTFWPTISGQTDITPVQYQVAALTIFLAWSLILSQVGKFPSIGIYLEIFGHVLRQFCHFLLCYVFLFVAFALAFSILFPGTQPYTIFPFAFLKLFVMMVGEMEYQDVFYDEATGRASGPIVGHVLMVTFVIMVAIVLMNLLIGLTVSDIRTVQKEAEVCRVSRQIVDMFHLESFIFSNKIPDFIKTTMYHMTSVAVQVKRQNSGRGLTNKGGRLNATHPAKNGDISQGLLLPDKKYVFKFLPNDPRDKSVPEKLKAAAMELALKLEDGKMDKVCMRDQAKFFERNIFGGRGSRGGGGRGGRGGRGGSGKFKFWKNFDHTAFFVPDKTKPFDPSSIPLSSV